MIEYNAQIHGSNTDTTAQNVTALATIGFLNLVTFSSFIATKKKLAFGEEIHR